MAVNEPAGTARSTPRRTGCGPKALATPVMRRSFTSTPLWSAPMRPSGPGCSGRPPHSGRLPVEPTPEHVARHGRDEHHDGRVRGGLVVGHVRLVGPELGGQRLHVRRMEHEGGGELRCRLQEHQREGGDQARPHQRERDAPHDRAPAHPERTGHLLEADRGPRHGRTDRHHGQRKEHDGVGDNQQRARLVEAALQEVLGHIGEAQRDHQAGHGEDHEIRSLQAEHLAPRETHRQEGDRNGRQRGDDTRRGGVPERVQRRVGQGCRGGQRAAPPLQQQKDDRSDRDAERQPDQETETSERDGPEATQRQRPELRAPHRRPGVPHDRARAPCPRWRAAVRPAAPGSAKGRRRPAR